MLFGCFLLIRAFQYDLFYDPFLQYFEGDHLTKPLPEINNFKLFGSYTFRYSLNSIVSFLILILSFKKQAFIKTILSFYLLMFVVLTFLFFSLILTKVDVGYLFLFYIRRFMIQPVFLIVLFPLLYLLKKGYRFN